MSTKNELLSHLQLSGISRRSFLKYCAVTASMLGLAPREATVIANTLTSTPKPTVIWLSFQECTGCTESLTRSYNNSIENLILNYISLDYHHTLQVASGWGAEQSRLQAMAAANNQYVLIVDGSIPLLNGGAVSTIAGQSNLDMLRETVDGAALVIAVGTCAAFGGLPMADPNPTQAVSVQALMESGQIANKPLINVSGCPPVPEVITGVVAYYLTYQALPALDGFNRPQIFYGKTVHDCCSRLAHYEAGEFAQSFDDEGARNGHCLYLLGCKGPTTFNACTTVKWNGNTSFPMHSGHGCLGCSEPQFWDAGSFYSVSNNAPAIGDGSVCAVPNVPVLPNN